MKTVEQECQAYVKPELVKIRNIKHITNECPNMQCSIVVPPPNG
jgi:hypothetical protein